MTQALEKWQVFLSSGLLSMCVYEFLISVCKDYQLQRPVPVCYSLRLLPYSDSLQRLANPPPAQYPCVNLLKSQVVLVALENST